MVKKSLYLAGPYGFSELFNHGVKSLMTILEPHFTVINPFTESQDLGEEIIRIQTQLKSGLVSHSEAIHQLKKINASIGAKNAKTISESEIIFAILDGADVDSGTAAEIGYAYGLGKEIHGYRGDFRFSGDNLGAKINLQVEHFIHASGGKIFYSLEEIRKDFLGLCSL